MTWPFPAFPNPLDTGRKQPVFNPNKSEKTNDKETTYSETK